MRHDGGSLSDTEEAREKYELEKLWTLGRHHDDPVPGHAKNTGGIADTTMAF